MISFRRIIACLLIMVFASASVLAATSFKLCFGADGHRAIEAVVTPHHHAQAVSTAAKSVVSKATSQTASNADCYDVGLFDTYQRQFRTGAKIEERGPLKVFGAFLAVYSHVSLEVVMCDSGSARHVDEGLIRPDPHLASLATIVLLN